ncbi:hypothetical protein BMS3Abin04_01842 [bacterium BMS3Abin04]|nr:hypothetical protein BMS3Abin04_01842 [bacterium BMS3Abin04]
MNSFKVKKDYFLFRSIIISLIIHSCLLLIFYLINFDNKLKSSEKLITIKFKTYTARAIKANRRKPNQLKPGKNYKSNFPKVRNRIKTKFIYFSKDFQNVIKELAVYSLKKQDSIKFKDSLIVANHNFLSLEYIMSERIKVLKFPNYKIRDNMRKYMLYMYKVKYNLFGNDYPSGTNNSFGGIHIPISSILDLFK